MHLVAHGQRTTTSPQEADRSPRLHKVLRRLSPGRRVAVLAALDAGADQLPADATLIVVAPRTAPSVEMISAAPMMAAACAQASARAFHSDPALILEMMDNIPLAALTIALGFTGDALSFGPGAGQLVEAVATAAERLDDGVPEVMVVTYREATGPHAPLGVAARWRRGAETGSTVVELDHDAGSSAEALQAWLRGLTGQRG